MTKERYLYSCCSMLMKLYVPRHNDRKTKFKIKTNILLNRQYVNWAVQQRALITWCYLVNVLQLDKRPKGWFNNYIS